MKRVFIGAIALGFLCTVSASARAPSGQYDTFGPDNVTIRDAKTKLTWERKVSPETFTWTAASLACSSRTTLGKIWRLPTVKELLTIVDEDVYKLYDKTDTLKSSAIDRYAFPDTPRTYFWSSTKVGSYAMVVDFEYGNTQEQKQDIQVYVRCVAD